MTRIRRVIRQRLQCVHVRLAATTSSSNPAPTGAERRLQAAAAAKPRRPRLHLACIKTGNSLRSAKGRRRPIYTPNSTTCFRPVAIFVFRFTDQYVAIARARNAQPGAHRVQCPAVVAVAAHPLGIYRRKVLWELILCKRHPRREGGENCNGSEQTHFTPIEHTPIIARKDATKSAALIRAQFFKRFAGSADYEDKSGGDRRRGRKAARSAGPSGATVHPRSHPGPFPRATPVAGISIRRVDDTQTGIVRRPDHAGRIVSCVSPLGQMAMMTAVRARYTWRCLDRCSCAVTAGRAGYGRRVFIQPCRHPGRTRQAAWRPRRNGRLRRLRHGAWT